VAEDDNQGWGIGSLLALGVVLVFVAVVLFGFLSVLAGAIWTLLKVAALVVILLIILRWVARRTNR
jgi:hypothetical protein